MDSRNLWYLAGQQAERYSPAEDYPARRWGQAVREAASLIEPGLPEHYSYGPFVPALDVLALALFSREDFDPGHNPAPHVIADMLAAPDAEEQIRDGLAARGHTASDDPLLAMLSHLTHQKQWDPSWDALPSFEQPYPGTAFRWAVGWADYWLRNRALQAG
ncbi:hypothetical protein [Streptacidiphilus jiangxiensis]|uniref:Uncharacterized protein n=1 Tax=Streptacidiphilus jiangxiensis TaxID=235985 RepID=A0A1H8BAK8_STRJI|nr:hypothetical protein [Streptacidiphilus jiangxiensis]SEM79048.1 hypothetical protein SAMN05414137_1599 [Streptacidiphilus jiangxiensis]